MIDPAAADPAGTDPAAADPAGTDPDAADPGAADDSAADVDVTRWLDAHLHGRARTGPVELRRERPWGRVWSAPTSDGPVWLKQPAPATAFEVALYPLLVRVVPDRVLHPIAVDVHAGRVLLPDGGPDLRASVDGEELVAATVEVLPVYGQLQRDLAGHVDEMLALGVADMRPEVLPERFRQVLEVVEPTLAHGTDDDRAGFARLCTAHAVVADLSAQLAAAPGPASLDHDDLHGGNVLAGPRFYDWGDAVVAHPFFSAFVALRVLRHLLGGDQHHPLLRRAVDAYLEPFTDLAPRSQLRPTLSLAFRLTTIARSLVWHRAVGADPAVAGEFVMDPLHNALGVLDPSPAPGS